MMPLSTEVTVFLKKASARFPGPVSAIGVVALREAFARDAMPSARPVRTLILPRQEAVPMAVFLPKQGLAARTICYIHGGGWVAGTLEGSADLAQRLADDNFAAVVFVEYSLAPENPYPKGLHDCLAVIEWLLSGGMAELGLPGPVVIAGDSAGGNLATAALLSRRDSGQTLPDGLVLIYPVLDVPDPVSPTYVRYGQGYGLSAKDMVWYWQQYLGTSNDCSAATAPLRSTQLGNLPPVLLLAAEHDVLHHEAERFAARLQALQHDIEYHVIPGSIHGCLGDMPDWAPVASARQLMAAWIARIGQRVGLA